LRLGAEPPTGARTNPPSDSRPTISELRRTGQLNPAACAPAAFDRHCQGLVHATMQGGGRWYLASGGVGAGEHER